LDQIRTLSLLKDLDLSKTKSTDAGLSQLYGLHNLKQLILHELKLSDAAIKKLQAALPQCKLVF
ncbi:MAG TPA: hypothetical protein VHY20_02765, partial [Pirellulales bacterium]|nr:hypothetical protein [Pirellulales bacterium]